jgi:predicted GNAT family acetyltransferase
VKRWSSETRRWGSGREPQLNPKIGFELDRLQPYCDMDVRPFDDAASFAREAGAYLAADPFSSSVIAVQVDGVLRGIRDGGPQDRYWTAVEGDRTLGIAMHTPPHNVFLARMPVAAAAALAQSLAATSRGLPGASGEVETVAAFVERWMELTDQRSSTSTSMRMYRLAELSFPAGVGGRARPAAPGDVDVVAAWLEAFHEEAQPHMPLADWRSQAEQRVRSGQFMLWEDNQQAVSVAAFSNAVAGVSRVGPVYTPPAQRRRGYGAAVTAHATAAAVNAGAEHVVLYTDLSNPTSNAIYQTIGYRPDHDAESRTFHQNDG